MGKFTPLEEPLYSYYQSFAVTEDDVLRELREETAGLEDARMQISAEQGNLLTVLAGLVSTPKGVLPMTPYSIIEIGTFTGYSAISLARGLAPGRKLLTCDVNEETLRTAEKYALKAGLDQLIDVAVGPGLVTLEDYVDKGTDDVDLIFIDADKENYTRYYEMAVTLLRPGGLICIDNVFWGGAVADPSDKEADTVAIRELNQIVKDDARVFAATVPIADGLTLARKL